MFYCKKCKLLYLNTSTDICECGRTMMFAEDDYLESYLDSGYKQYDIVEKEAMPEREEKETGNVDLSVEDRELEERAKKRRQRNQELYQSAYSETAFVKTGHSTEAFSTAELLKSLGLIRKS